MMIALLALQLGQAEKAKRHQEQGEKEAPDSVEPGGAVRAWPTTNAAWG